MHKSIEGKGQFEEIAERIKKQEIIAPVPFKDKEIASVELPEGFCDLVVYKCYYDVPQTTRLHTHGFIEIALVANGRGCHIINNHQISIQKGDFFIFGKTPPHSFFPIDERNLEKLTVVNLFISDKLFEQLIEEKNLTDELLEMFSPQCKDFIYHKQLDIQNTNIANSLIEKILYELVIADEFYKKMSRLYFSQMLIHILRANSPKNIGLISNRIETAVNYIHDNFNKSISLSQISILVSTSQSHFSKIFKKAIGMSITEYIQKIRIDKACELLISTEKSVPQISQEVGYESLRFFYTIFKKVVGVSPREYETLNKKSYHIIKTII